MSDRSLSRVPTYRLHKQSRQAIVTLPDGLGNRHDVLLGKYGTAASRTEYARVIAEWEANGRRLPRSVASPDLTTGELILAFWPHAETHYRRPDGTQTKEVEDYKLSLRPLRKLYGATSAKNFGPLALKAIRQQMIESDLSRGVINQRIGRIRRLFKWAVENELVPAAVHQALLAVPGIPQGRGLARETQPVKPAPDVHVDATLPFVLPPVAAMVRLQLLTGMRPGEACIMRACDIDMSGPVWFYRPGSDLGRHGAHKTAHHGKDRVIAIGPRGQAIVKQFLQLDLTAYLFSPRLALEEARAARRSKRQTPVQPSQVYRKKRRPRKAPGLRYTSRSYANAIGKACKKASVPRWHPHQLRHNHGTEVRRRWGIEGAEVALGHSQLRITELYAEKNAELAARIASALG